MQRAMLDYGDDEIDELLATADELRAQGLDYSTRAGNRLAAIFKDEHNYRVFYDTFWKPRHEPNGPEDPWKAQKPDQLVSRLTGYLALKIRCTAGRGSNGLVCQGTLRTWTDDLSIAALQQLMGRPSEEHSRDSTLFTGRLPNKSDSIPAQLRTWSVNAANKFKLDRKVPHHEFWDLPEAAVMIDDLFAAIMDDPERAQADLQNILQIQLVLLTLARPGAYSQGMDMDRPRTVLPESSIVILQQSRGVYAVAIPFTALKGFSKSHHEAAFNKPVIPAITQERNLQFDFAATLIPILLARSGLVSRACDGTTTLHTSPDTFLADNSTPFASPNDAGFPLARRGLDVDGGGDDGLGRGTKLQVVCGKIRSAQARLYCTTCAAVVATSSASRTAGRSKRLLSITGSNMMLGGRSILTPSRISTWPERFSAS